MMTTASTDEASGRLTRAHRPSGLSRKSPTVAPSGRVRMNAAQNRQTRLTLVREIEDRQDRQPGAEYQRAAASQAPAAGSELSAVQSPSAVPSVWEKVIVIQ